MTAPNQFSHGTNDEECSVPITTILLGAAAWPTSSVAHNRSSSRNLYQAHRSSETILRFEKEERARKRLPEVDSLHLRNHRLAALVL